MTRRYKKRLKNTASFQPKEEPKEWQARVYKKVTYKNNPNWKAIRTETLLRDGFRCIRCEDGKNRRNLTAHHLIPRSEGGGDNLENLVTLCPPCHDFVEVNNLRTFTEIIASFDSPVHEKEVVEKKVVHEESFERPDWHAWVYGGVRRRN